MIIIGVLGMAMACLVTLVATPAVTKWAIAYALTDKPDGVRKLHRAVTPSLGGIAIICGTAMGIGIVVLNGSGVSDLGLTQVVYVVGGAIVMAFTGAVDDIRGLGFRPKLVVEAAVALGLVHGGVGVEWGGGAVGGAGLLTSAASTLIVVLWVVGVTNAVNLIDGVDGLAAGVAGLAFASLAVAVGIAGDLLLVAIAGAFLGALGGFLVYNFRPASIFKGDSGSLFLGYSLAVYGLYAYQAVATPRPIVAVLVPILALGLPILDTLLSMVRRAAGKGPLFAPDRDHIHHRMVDRMPTGRAVLVLYGVASMFGVLAVLASLSSWTGGTAVVATAAVIVVGVLLRLGYVRLPYAPPILQPLASQAMPPSSLAVPLGAVHPRDGEAMDGGALPGEHGDGVAFPPPEEHSEPALSA